MTCSAAEGVFEDHLRLRAAGDIEEDLRRNYAVDVVLLTANSNLEAMMPSACRPNACASSCLKVSSTTSQNRSAAPMHC